MTTRNLSAIDRLLAEADSMLRSLSRRGASAARPSPAEGHSDADLTPEEQRHAAGLMRVNHTGEVCAQALYQGQALTARTAGTRDEMLDAAQEEIDHLVWCEERLQELNARPSALNPLFYGASLAMGAAAGAISDKMSLGFVHATEERVASHLRHHLKILPRQDRKSQLILQKMLEDEERHGANALKAGGEEFPRPIKDVMSALSQLMTRSTYYL
ncbi:2-polyprenyl-3-methyl-6-methoxy-1,4-benzoquinone monooxygenase [Luminiphilus syltensis]|nr:2-polyprenyl-3-methyl-6-methoxy-1,4-benzoquinone monooxygenase [Luminiphilus syltensis]